MNSNIVNSLDQSEDEYDSQNKKNEENEINNEEDLESGIIGDFITFNDHSKVLEDCPLDYKTILSNFFDLSPFKKMTLNLIYRSSKN